MTETTETTTTTIEFPRPAPPSWAELASIFVSELESEVLRDAKNFYGNSVVPSEGRGRLEAGLRAVNSLKSRLEALNRGK
jgi:hypothetical protein